jgi:ADP-heptose:LPS heptosyltransferase
MEPMRILALVPGEMSEQSLFFPTLKTLKAHYPQALIDVVVEPKSKAAYSDYPEVHEILTFDFRDRNGLADYLNLLGMVRDREYDIAISTTPNWALDLLLWLNGIPVRVGYKNTSSWFITNPVELRPEQDKELQYQDLLQGLGIKPTTAPNP